MARLFSTLAEELAIKTLCSSRKEVAGTLMSAVDIDTFHTDAAKEAYERIQKILQHKGEVPSFSVLCSDPKLSDETREKLLEVTKNIRTVEGAQDLADKLLEHRRARGAYFLGKKIMSTLEKPTIDIDDLVAFIQKEGSKLAQVKSQEETIFNIGKDDNTLDLAESILFEKREPVFIPTGFVTFDDRNGGFLRRQATLVAGTTGAGKSSLAGQLAMNQASIGYKVVLVPLEMGVDETIARMIANVAKLENKEVQFQKLTENEKNLAWKRWRRFQKKIANAGGRLTLYKPTTEVSMQQVFAALHTYSFDICYIDYIGLLAGVNGDRNESQWLQMGNAVRYGKIYADQTNRAVVVLAQLDSEGKVRYSRAMEEHAATTWYFVATKESRESGNVRFDMTKGRNQELMSFVLGNDPATQSWRDLQVESNETTTDQATGGSSSNKEGSEQKPGSNAAKYLDDIAS